MLVEALNCVAKGRKKNGAKDASSTPFCRDSIVLLFKHVYDSVFIYLNNVLYKRFNTTKLFNFR